MGCTAIGNMALNVFGLVFEGKKTQLQPETKQEAEWLEFFKAQTEMDEYRDFINSLSPPESEEEKEVDVEKGEPDNANET